MMAKLIAAAVLYWLLKPEDDGPEGTVDIGDDWTADFNAESGKWSDDYRRKQSGDIP